jgi:hypothetical protein
MSETPTRDPNQSSGQEALRPFSELLARTDVVYHGIGADLVALDGVAAHGLLSASQQMELTDSHNTNSPRDAAWNGDDKVSVAKAPQSGLPNVAFMTYVESSPLTFAIDSSKCVPSQPADRGFYDEAFIDGAPDEAIVGVVLDSATMARPITEMPIIDHLTTADKARGFMSFLIKNYDSNLEAGLPELENLIDGITYSTSPFVGNNDSIISNTDGQSVERINSFLQTKLATALETKFGRSNLTVLDMVCFAFPSKTLYVNNHNNGIALHDEQTYFDALPDDAIIGYQRFDGAPGNPSLEKLRRAIRDQRG